MAIHPNQIIHWSGGNCVKLFGTATRRTAPSARRGEEIIETFARATPPASYVDSLGEVKLAEVDALRVNMLDLDVAGVFDVPAIGLEDTRTNVCLQSEDIATTWVLAGTPITTVNDAIAPDGKTTADKLEDDNAGAGEGKTQTITIANDSTTWTVSYYVKKAPAAAPVVSIRAQLTGGTAKDAELFVDPINGASIANAQVVDSDVIDAGDYYRVWLSVANNGTGNTSLVFGFHPARRLTGDVATALLDVTAIGSNHFWGFQAENAATPSSYIATTTVSVTRARDIMTFPWVTAPRTVIGYARFVERGTILAATATRVLQIGDSTGGGDPRLFISQSSNIYAVTIDDGTNSKNSAMGTGPVYGDLVELRLIFDKSAGTIQLGQSINGAAEVVAAAGTGLDKSLLDAWAGTILTLNATGGGGLSGYIDLLDLMFADGAGHSRADFREATQQ